MLKSSRGVTLVELMVATAILSIVVLAGVSSFSLIARGIRGGRSKTIAANLVQEKMEVLKNMNYYQLLITTDTDINTDFTPNLVYDRTNYPAETITLWGLPAFHRAVNINYAAVSSNTVSAASSNAYDTGMKLITVYLWWNEDSSNKKIEIRTLYANPDAANLDSGFKGLVTGTGGAVLTGARISVVGNPEWSTTATSDASVNFTLPVTGGTYSILFSADGYYDKILSGQVCVRGGYTTVATQQLTAILTGNVQGVVWISSHVLISQVVASTPTGGGAEVEYVELYNPTTYTWTANDTWLQLWYDHREDGTPPAKISLTYNTPSISSNTYYLIANQPSITVAGVTRTADAQYTSLGVDKIRNGLDGGVAIMRNGADAPEDAFAWSDGIAGDEPPVAYTYGTAITGALDVTQQYVRFTSTAEYISTLGSSYNTYNNSVNFQRFNPISVPPKNSSVSLAHVSGVPAHNAMVVANDGYSAATFAGSSGMGTAAEYAVFILPGVSTGSWTVTIASGSYTRSYSGVAVTNGGTTWIPNAATSSAWTVANHNDAVLISTTSGGFIEGYVYKDGADYWVPFQSCLVEANGTKVRTASNGYFLINSATGAVTVNANSNSDNPAYVTDSYNTTVVQDAFVVAPPHPYFHLGSSGRITGYVTSGTAAIPNVVVKAVRGVATYETTSTQTGYFYISVPVNAASYTVTPVLDPIQTFTSDPDPLVATISASGSTVHVGTITVIGGSGTVSGTVREGSSIITTGVLIVASEAPFATIGNPPPMVYASSAPGQAYIYYSGSSSADGTFSLSVRASSALNMRAYYSTVDPATGAITSKTPKDIATVTVTAGGATTGKDFTW